jgi:IS4 transposase
MRMSKEEEKYVEAELKMRNAILEFWDAARLAGFDKEQIFDDIKLAVQRQTDGEIEF